MRITMVGHSTVIIEAGGVRFLTDPFFAARTMPGTRRTHPPAMSAGEAALVDAVLLSHTHPDHCDPAFFEALPAGVPVFAVDGTSWPSAVRRPAGARTLAEWDSFRIGGANVTVTPADHPGPACGFIVGEDGPGGFGDRGPVAYFAGDTRHAPFMAEIGPRYDPGVALLPLRNVRVAPVMGVSQVVSAARDLTCRVVVPIHCGIRTAAAWLTSDDAVDRLREEMSRELPDITLTVLAEGETLDVPR